MTAQVSAPASGLPLSPYCEISPANDNVVPSPSQEGLVPEQRQSASGAVRGPYSTAAKRRSCHPVTSRAPTVRTKLGWEQQQRANGMVHDAPSAHPARAGPRRKLAGASELVGGVAQSDAAELIGHPA